MLNKAIEVEVQIVIIQSPTHQYDVDEKVAETDRYRLYLATQQATCRQCLFQIAVEAANNGALDRAAFVLKDLEQQAQRLEDEYERVKIDPKVLLNYQLGFPELLESFILEEQGGRRVNILAFRNVDDVHNMIPISKIIGVNRLRIDLRTSVWVMGKALKLLAFAHSVGFSIGRQDPASILLETEKHYVVFFDLSLAVAHNEPAPPEVVRTEIAQAAQTVIALLGGDHEARTFPSDGEDERTDTYIRYLLELAAGGETDASRAHTRLYELADELWERAYYPFTIHPRTRTAE